MKTVVELNVRNGYNVIFYKLQGEFYLEVINRAGEILGNTKLSEKDIENINKIK